MANEKYDLIVIGGGAGGSSCAHAANEAGYHVAQIERDRIGGTCLNYGCDPTKTMLHIAKMMHEAAQTEPYGVRVDRTDVRWSAVLERVRAVQNDMRGGEPEEARANMRRDGITLIKGEASFVSSHEVAVNGARRYGENILIATGAEPLIPDLPGLREVGFLTNKEAVFLPVPPRRLAIVGAGPVGTEFAQLFCRFGVDVSLFEAAEHILPQDDKELAEDLAALLSEEGVGIHTNARLMKVEQSPDGKRLFFDCGGGEEERVFDEILLALGRQPALAALNLDAAGVAVEDGKLVVDETLRTSVPHIWAAGDIVTEYPFTHTAVAQSELLAHNIFADTPAPFDNRAIPWVTYTSPELAHVGQTEDELKQAGVDYRVARVRFRDVARAQTNGQKQGQVKLLVGRDDSILGGHILGAGAGDLIAPIVLAMRNNLPISALRDVILPYPTLVGAVRQAARA